MPKKKLVKCFERTTTRPPIRKYVTCKSTKTGRQLRKGSNLKRKEGGMTKVQQKARKLAPKIRRRPPPPPPPPSRDAQMNMLRRGINPLAPIFQ